MADDNSFPATAPPGPVRRRAARSDGQRNRQRLLLAAKQGFGEVGPDVSLEEIARRAGVGIGTLYRHFPSRDALIEAVYHQEVEQLTRAARTLLESHDAGEALHQWMRMFIDYVASKKLIAPALASRAGGPSELYESSGRQLTETIKLLVQSAIDAGHIKQETDPLDIMRALIGFAYTNVGDEWDVRAFRLIDILMAGMRT